MACGCGCNSCEDITDRYAQAVRKPVAAVIPADSTNDSIASIINDNAPASPFPWKWVLGSFFVLSTVYIIGRD
jgi:hypothetical protein